MDAIFSYGPVVSGLIIFLLRICDMALDTIRVLFVVRGKKKLAWVLGFFQSLIFILAISSVLANANNWLNVLGYAAGFATGNVVGMFIEERMALGHIHLTIYSSTRGSAVAEALRKDGYAVTEVAGRGKDGTVTVLHCSVLRKQVDAVETVVLEEDPAAFITTADVRQVRRGFWRA
jgi:uncharacterized protein YebE (UPF0316 family)